MRLQSYTTTVLRRVRRDGMSESSLVEAARQWVTEKYKYNSYHLLDSLDWLDRIAPGSHDSVRLATLTHDMERAFPGPDQPKLRSLVDSDYHRAHSERSARIVGAWLRERGASEMLTREVEALIRVHEDGGWTEANLVQAADSLSFLNCNVDLFLNMVRSGQWPADQVRLKFNYSYDRIQEPHAKALALPMLEKATAKLTQLEAEIATAALPEPKKGAKR